MTTQRDRTDLMVRLVNLGIELDDAQALRRISMTLQRWFELECGNGNSYGSWAIERDDNGDGPPFLVHHHYNRSPSGVHTSRTRIPDKETGARKRLARIMARYPTLGYYVQTDPRGCALYILPPGAVPESGDLSDEYSHGILYSHGIPVYK